MKKRTFTCIQYSKRDTIKAANQCHFFPVQPAETFMEGQGKKLLWEIERRYINATEQ